MKWTLIDDPLEKKVNVYYIETDGLNYVAEITYVKRLGNYILNLYADDKAVARPREFKSFTRAKRSGQSWMSGVLRANIKNIEKIILDLKKVE